MKGIWTKVIIAAGVFVSLVALFFMFGGGQRYKSLTPNEAAKIMESNRDCVVLDVRTQTEYGGGHIPGAVCLPIDDIRENAASVQATLPDKHQVLLIYCYAGRRAVEAAQLLSAMGYTNAYEFGGIVDWTGEVVTD